MWAHKPRANRNSTAQMANSTRQDVVELLDLAPKVPIRTEVQPFQLQQANEALASLKEGKLEGAAVLNIP